MLNMPSTKVLINSRAREGKGNPAACLISEKDIFRNIHLSLFNSRLIFLRNKAGTKVGGNQAIICRAFAIYNCVDKNQTAVISQRIELSQFSGCLCHHNHNHQTNAYCKTT